MCVYTWVLTYICLHAEEGKVDRRCRDELARDGHRGRKLHIQVSFSLVMATFVFLT